jgi:hypothetical protein
MSLYMYDSIIFHLFVPGWPPPLPSLFPQEYTQIMDRQCGMDTKKISYIILNHNAFFFHYMKNLE